MTLLQRLLNSVFEIYRLFFSVFACFVRYKNRDQWWTMAKKLWRNMYVKLYERIFLKKFLCKPHDIRQCTAFLFWFWFRYNFFSIIHTLFHFNRFELCGITEKWLIFHYRNTNLFPRNQTAPTFSFRLWTDRRNIFYNTNTGEKVRIIMWRSLRCQSTLHNLYVSLLFRCISIFFCVNTIIIRWKFFSLLHFIKFLISYSYTFDETEWAKPQNENLNFDRFSFFFSLYWKYKQNI